MARWGLVSKGILYALVGLIAVDVSVASGERIRDRGGALSALADTWPGKLLVGAVAVGLLGYSLWRFAEVLLGRTLEGGEQLGLLKRLGVLARGVWYLGLLGVAASALAGADEPADREDRFTARVLEFPAGRWLVAAVGLGILGAGVFNLWRGVTGRFKRRLKLRKMGELEERAFTVIGVVGHLARALVFGLMGLFLVRAAWQFDAKETIGLDGALAKVLRQDYGDTLLGLVAGGLLAYGLYCFVEARYREV
ncbi:MAG TPA: DUF1206 domain-containing protein [Gaiellaceae bacterium]|nr:DUF1206 domain-containing protein [Gaiellaceae bacterium]